MIGSLDYNDIGKARKRISEFSLLEPMKPWPFAKLCGPGVSTTMRLAPSGVSYWRDSGAWGVGFEVKDDRIFAKATCGYTTHLTGLEFKEISKEEWAKENSDEEYDEDNDPWTPDNGEDDEWEDDDFEDELPYEENFL